MSKGTIWTIGMWSLLIGSMFVSPYAGLAFAMGMLYMIIGIELQDNGKW